MSVAPAGNANGTVNGARRIARTIAVLWPSFLVAAVAEFALFAVVDPAAIHLAGDEPLSRPATYTIGFFAFWALGALSSAFTLYFARQDAAAAPRPHDAP